MIQIIRETQENGYHSFEMTSGKKTAEIVAGGSLNLICVLCNNAAHRAYRGIGNTFRTWDEALNHYKSTDMKSMIEYARSACETAKTV